MVQKFISATHAQTHFKEVTDEVQKKRTSFVVLKHSRPAYRIAPLEKLDEQSPITPKDIPVITSPGTYALEIDKIIY